MKRLWHSVSLFVTLVIAFVVASSYEGSDLPDDQVEQVLALYNRHCRSAYGLSSSPGQNVHVVCKEGREDYGPPKKQVIKIPPGPPPKKNILFVEAPAYKVKHDITLVGDTVKPPRTVIYVLPNKNHHNFNFLYRNGQHEVPKPQVYFLGHKAQGGIGSPPLGGYPGPVETPSQVYGTTNVASIATVQTKPVPHGPLGGYKQSEYLPPINLHQNQYQTSEPPSSYQSTSISSTSSNPPEVPEYIDQPPIPVPPSQSQPEQSSSQQSGRNEELSLPGLGPEYELVPADPETLSQYERYFTHIQNGYSSAVNRVKNHHSRSIGSGDLNLPLGFTIQSTGEYEQINQNQDTKPESQPSTQSETDVPRVTQTEETKGRIIFPDESIQQFRYSSLSTEATTEEPTTTTTTEAPVTRKTISHLQRNLFKRKSHIPKVIFPDDPIPEKYLLSYNDYYNYMGSPGSQEVEVTSSSSSKENSSKKGKRKRIRNKSRSSKESSQQKLSDDEKAVEIQDRIASIASANSALKSQNRQTSSPFHAKLLLAFASKAEMDSTSPAPRQFSHYRTVYTTQSTTTSRPSASTFYSNDDLSSYTVVENLRISGNSRNRKRSNSPAYEMIPASLVSYSYSKV